MELTAQGWRYCINETTTAYVADQSVISQLDILEIENGKECGILYFEPKSTSSH
jgi:hypothetical protein